jgi:hypothetical protein
MGIEVMSSSAQLNTMPCRAGVHSPTADVLDEGSEYEGFSDRFHVRLSGVIMLSFKQMLPVHRTMDWTHNQTQESSVVSVGRDTFCLIIHF